MPKQPTGLSQLSKSQKVASQSSNIFPARVKFALLDDKEEPQAFKDFGGWSSLGCVFFTKLDNPNPTPGFQSDNFAIPLFPNNSNIPLKNEIVYVMSLPNNNVQSNVGDETYYYFQSINLWNSTHHNAIPDPLKGDNLPQSQQQDYEQTSTGNVRRVTDGGTEIDLGLGFEEKLSIRNLQPYVGDLIYQGRWGQSLRFGSTLKNAGIPNTWSNDGDDGDPITIIKNGQHEEDTEPWVPQVEDINTDASSIYLTSTQEIPIEVASNSYKSYDSAPISPNKFIGEQIILNSGRLLLNSKNDSILLNSFNSINLNAVNSLNVDAPKTVISSSKIFLGNKNATESVILGDKFLGDLQKLILSIISLTSALATPIGSGPPNVINAAIPGPAIDTQTKAQNMLNKIEAYKSIVSKTK
jgi:hypothetical protein